MAPADILSVDNENWVCRLRNLFTFFAASCLKHVFKEHLHYLVRECKISPVCFLSRFFTEEDVPIVGQVESLQCFAYLCNEDDNRWLVELLAEFPSILVALSNDKQDIRIAAMGCIEGLYTLWRRVDFSSKKNGNTAVWSHFLDELLGMMVQQRRLIISDKSFLSSFLTSLLSSSCNNLPVPRNIEQRLCRGFRSLSVKSVEALLLMSNIGSAIWKILVYIRLDDLKRNIGQHFWDEHIVFTNGITADANSLSCGRVGILDWL